MKLLIFWLLSAACLVSCIPTPRVPDSLSQSSALKLVDQGTYFLRTEDLDQAEASFHVAAQLGELPQAYDGLGCVSFLRGDIYSAEHYFIRALSVDSQYYQALANLALLYESRGLFQKAEELYQSAIQQDPGNFRSRNNFGVYLAAQRGDIEEAKFEFIKAQAITAHPLIEKNLERMKNYEK